MTITETTPMMTSTVYDNTVLQTPFAYPQYPLYHYPQYVPQQPQYVPQLPQYVPQQHLYVPPPIQLPLYYPDGCYCEIQYVSPQIVSKSNSSQSSPLASSQPPQTEKDSLAVSM